MKAPSYERPWYRPSFADRFVWPVVTALTWGIGVGLAVGMYWWGAVQLQDTLR